MCNIYVINWSGSEESSHICLYICALFLRSKMDNKIFRLLIKLTKKAMKKKEAPIAAVIVLNKKIIESYFPFFINPFKYLFACANLSSTFCFRLGVTIQLAIIINQRQSK